MIAIGSTGYTSTIVSGRKTPQRRPLAPFSVFAPEGKPAPVPVAETGPMNLLLLQEDEGKENARSDRQAEEWGWDILDVLKKVQVALLEGESPTRLLRLLGSMAESAPRAASPALTSAIRAIRVRAAVEAARTGRQLPLAADGD